MIVHTFHIRFKPGTADSAKQRFLTEVKGFAGQFAGLKEVYAGLNFSPRANGHELGAVMLFESEAALDEYAKNPVHQKFLSWAAPLVEATDVDFVA